jgi:rSAM/selenodomain-associated transferase 1
MPSSRRSVSIDAITKTRRLCKQLLIAFFPNSEKDYLAGLDFENITLIEQRGADLGEKMGNAFDFAFALYSSANVIMIGTDSPTFPPSFIERAFELLESGSETVLGKSADGGFYLIGLRKTNPHLFDNIEWSSPKVFEQISGNLKKLKIETSLIRDWYDVDTPEDFAQLRNELLNNRNARKNAPNTYKWLISGC